MNSECESENVAAAIVAELQRQAVETGCTVETNGTHVQVDGSFALGPLADAVKRSFTREGDS